MVIYVSPSGKDAAVELGIAYANGAIIFGLHAKGEDLGLMRKVVDNWFERYKDLIAEIDKLSNAGL